MTAAAFLAAGLALTPAGAAFAADEPEGPVDSGGEYVLQPQEDYGEQNDTELEACGSTITLKDGDVREVEVKTVVEADGSFSEYYRGDYTLDVVREDGKVLDELDAGGQGYFSSSADGLVEVYAGVGPSLAFATSEKEAAAFEEAGLPAIFYYTEGFFSETIVYSTDEEAEDPLSWAEVNYNDTRDEQDICQLLDDA